MFQDEISNEWGNKVNIRFSCSDCGFMINGFATIPCPEFNSERDTHEGTLTSTDYYFECENCHKRYNVELQSSMLGSWLIIHELPDDAYVVIENTSSDPIDDVLNWEDTLYDNEDIPENNNYDSIKYDRNLYSVYELKRKYDRDQIILNSSFQRGNVWTRRQRCELVESVLVGLPIPIFYLNQNDKGQLIVVDGRQRLTALFDYMNDGFSLKNLKLLPKSFEVKFNSLPAVYKSRLEDYQISAYVILASTDERVKYDIFDRVNRGGTKVNKQEIRNALHQGLSTTLLFDISQSNSFKYSTDWGLGADKRMKGCYLILRFVSMYFFRKGTLKSYNFGSYTFTNMDDLLADSMEYINSMKIPEYNELVQYITESFKRFECYLPSDICRLEPEKHTPINMNVFEVLLYIIAQLNDNLDAGIVESSIKELKKAPAFIDSIGNHRDSIGKINIRFDLADKVVEYLNGNN